MWRGEVFAISDCLVGIVIHLKPRPHRPLRCHTTTYDGYISVIADHRGESCVIVRRCTASQPSRVIARCLGSFCNIKKKASIPSIVGYRKIILLGRTRSHNVAQRHIAILCNDRATSCNGRAMVVC